MSGSNVVIVESPAKAKTINKYLGSDYTVVASFGHVRDLPARDGSVRPDEDFAMEWELGDRSKRHIDEIARAVRGAKRVYLATDPDREGEAIAWHLTEVLREKRLLDKVDVQRITFNEITKSAVQAAIASPRAVSRDLVDAYLARRALDYLVGFTLSPVLWRKLPGSRSAGRVQSVALRLICEREAEIEVFKPQEYWTVDVGFTTPGGAPFTASLTHLDGKKLDKFGLPNKAAADAAVAAIEPRDFSVSSVERRQVRRNPYAPFTTSTLQQEASRKLGFGATRTMRIAQKLYEGVDIGGETVGLITYMRTDGVSLSQEAIESSRSLIGQLYGDNYVPKNPRIYKTAAKNAQEAHEAIRPTDLFRKPPAIAAYLDKDELRLYELIWKRTVASQMESAVLDQVSVDVASPDRKVVLRATGSIVVFDGYMRVYQEDRDDEADEQERRLPAMAEGDALKRGAINPAQHFTQPPPRYTEASLVKKLEELGIGRPSTYASILQVLQDREYVRLDKRRFIPEDRGRLVTAFLKNFFQRYVEYNFTADLENKLDDVSDGRMDWKTVLRDFWHAFFAAVGDTKDLTITQVLNALDEELGAHFFPGGPEVSGADPRVCPSCHQGRLGLKLGKMGAFIGCSNYPECRYTRPLAVANDDGQEVQEGPRLLGDDPETGLPVTVRRGPYGAYIQLGPAPGGEKDEEPAARTDEKPKKGKKTAKAEAPPKPKRVSLPKGMAPADVDLDTALKLLALPRTVGPHPETQQEIQAGIGRFGPYLKHGSVYKSLPPDDDVLTIGLNRAVVLLGEAAKKASTPGRELGAHPKTGKPVTLGAGRFGPYVKHASLYASIPKGVEPDSVTLAQALEWLDAKAVKDAGKKAPAKAATDGETAEPAAKPKAKTTKVAAKPAAAKAPAKTATKTTAKAPAKAKTAAKPKAADDEAAPPRRRAKTA
ncbi:type I DNA topoisomerase [Azospirillum sp. RWY-5-1]|uniref:DNA topoisomerase 1 n=1 Tax=Azospirillum oleiclasticum TaxID=2735135 RepID=A0ABX2T2U2_9PROT|nr:type I DNA topoisomerase [Azospirillum oleiclasticum]NYZ11407.1 type I DNA topoisomerase [Azospirillum oleiclasticum]NYZ18568.1 type I DNA topoisomerase [Azospirillum oleiclasticum]